MAEKSAEPGTISFQVERILDQDPTGAASREELLSLHSRLVEEVEEARELETEVRDLHKEVRDADSELLWSNSIKNTKGLANQLDTVSEQLESVGIEPTRQIASERNFDEITENERSYREAVRDLEQAIVGDQKAQSDLGVVRSTENQAKAESALEEVERKREALAAAKELLQAEIFLRRASTEDAGESVDRAQEARARTGASWDEDLRELAQKLEDEAGRREGLLTAAEHLELKLLELDGKKQTPERSRALAATFDELTRYNFALELNATDLRDARAAYEAALRKIDNL